MDKENKETTKQAFDTKIKNLIDIMYENLN